MNFCESRSPKFLQPLINSFKIATTKEIFTGSNEIGNPVSFSPELLPHIHNWNDLISPIQSIKFSISYISFFDNTTIKFNNLPAEITKHIDESLKMKISKDDYLMKVLLSSIIKIKKYLDAKRVRYELNSFIWNDIEDNSWEENIISVKTEYKTNKEKRKIWDDIDEIVGKQEKKEEGKVIILTQVDRYES
jgi:hypothetical protein